MVCPCAGNEEFEDFVYMVFECVIRYLRIIIYLVVIDKVVISSQFYPNRLG